MFPFWKKCYTYLPLFLLLQNLVLNKLELKTVTLSVAPKDVEIRVCLRLYLNFKHLTADMYWKQHGLSSF